MNKKAMDIIKECEGFRAKAYYCPAGKVTIGYGHTKGVKIGDECSEADAEAWLVEDMYDAANAVKRLVTAPLNDNQMGALISFVFNLGANKIKNSTLIRKLNSGDYEGAANEFPRWIYSGGNILNGLKKRRELEKALFLEPIAEILADL